MFRVLGILIWFSLIPSISIAQENDIGKKSSFAIGGDLFWNSRYKLKENSTIKNINVSSAFKLGYFLSNNDFLLLRPRITWEHTTIKPSGPTDNEITLGGDLIYRRFFGKSLFGGIFLGGEWERMYATNYVSGKPAFDKESYAGLELGYVYFLNPRVGIESVLYYSIRRANVIRSDYTSQYNYTRAGINIGILYLFKLKKHTIE